MFDIKSTYSFSVYAEAFLGSNFDNVTVASILDQESANQLIDTQAMHVAVFPFLPPGTPNDPSAYNYVKFKTQTNGVLVLGIPWIRDSTIQLVDAQTIVVKIGNAKSSDIARIRNMLNANGFNELDFSII